jgi:group II intron reverse transcriptase/maturase
VLRRLVNPIFEPLFHANSYGFRAGRSCHLAVERVLELREAGFTHVVDADVKGFFDNIPHQVIMEGLAAEIADGNILTLIERFLTAGVIEEGVFQPTTQGTPQGGVISPLLANIALNRLDWQLHQAGYQFVRYADDFVVLCQTAAEAREAHEFVDQRLTDIGLTLSVEKTKVTQFSRGFLFLGFELTTRYVTMRSKSVEKFQTRIRQLTIRSRNFDAKVVEQVNQVVRGVANYFATSFSHVFKRFESLDEWLRMRLRSMKYKRKSKKNNSRLPVAILRKMGFLFLNDLNPRYTVKTS